MMIEFVRRFVELIEDSLFLIKRDGWKSSFFPILKEIVRLPYRRIHFFILARPLEDPIPEFKPKCPITILPFTENDLEFVRIEYLPSEAKLCQRRLSSGQLGFSLSINSQTAGYCWLAEDDRLERVRISIKSGDILAPDAYTARDFRHKGVRTFSALELLRTSRKLGYTRIITYIDINNTLSLKIWQNKLGAQVIGFLDFKRIGFWRKTRFFEVMS